MGHIYHLRLNRLLCIEESEESDEEVHEQMNRFLGLGCSELEAMMVECFLEKCSRQKVFRHGLFLSLGFLESEMISLG